MAQTSEATSSQRVYYLLTLCFLKAFETVFFTIGLVDSGLTAFIPFLSHTSLEYQGVSYLHEWLTTSTGYIQTWWNVTAKIIPTFLGCYGKLNKFFKTLQIK